MGVAAAGGTAGAGGCGAALCRRARLSCLPDPRRYARRDRRQATFGKPIGSDKAEEKTTFVDLLGLAACEREVVRLTDEAISALSPFGGEADFLAALSHSMETRNK